MPKIRFSGESERDIDGIAAYTTATWSWRQTHKYLAQLEDGIGLIAQNPSIGRACDELHAGLRRFEVGHHVIFYLTENAGIFVVRVLHQNMLPGNYI